MNVNLPCMIVLLVSGAICLSSFFLPDSVFVMKMALYCKICIMFQVHAVVYQVFIYYIFIGPTAVCTSESLDGMPAWKCIEVYFEFICKDPLGQLRQVSSAHHFRLKSEQS